MTEKNIRISTQGTDFMISDGVTSSQHPHEFPGDKSHFQTLYKEIQRLAAENPNDVINIEYGSAVTSGYIDLQNLINCFSKHPQLLPKNVNLKFVDQTKQDKPIPFNIMICGTGGIDTNPESTLRTLFPELNPGTDCAYKLYTQSTEQLNLQRTETTPGVDISSFNGKTVPIRTREGKPQNFVPEVVQTWAQAQTTGVSKVVLHMQSAMNPPHPGHIQMLLATAEDIAQKAAAKGEKVDVVILAELAPEWYLQSKLAVTGDEVRKQFSFETRKKLMTYLSHDLVPMQEAAMKERNPNLQSVKFVVNPDPVIFDHPDRVRQMQEGLGSMAQVFSVQGIDSHAWTFEQLSGLSFISLTRGGDFPKERAELEKKIAQSMSSTEQQILQAILEFNHELSIFSSSKLMSLKDQAVVDLMQNHSPLYTDYFLKKLESKIFKTLSLDGEKKDSAISSIRKLLFSRESNTQHVSLDNLDENTRKFMLARLEKHLQKIGEKITSGTIILPTEGPQEQYVKELLQLVQKQQQGELKGEAFEVFLGEIRQKMYVILQGSEPSPLKDELNRKIERDPFVRVLLKENSPHAAARAAGP